MTYLLKNGQVYMNRQITKADICIENGHIISISPEITSSAGDFFIIDCSDKLIVPGLIDVHNHGNSGADFSDGNYLPATMEAISSAKLSCFFSMPSPLSKRV